MRSARLRAAGHAPGAAAPCAWKHVLCRRGDKLVGLGTLKSGEGRAVTDRR